jgi:hypothetical protein
MSWIRCAFVLTLAGLAGCRSQVAENSPPAPELRLGDHTDIALADWLTKPRAELARQAEEMASNVEKQQELTRTNRDSVDLLPQLHAPVTVPVFERCRYSQAAGFSLPPYLPEGKRDACVALHLARHGDREAALKLADPADKALLGQIDAFRTSRNYPLEWTRLVALTLQSALFKLAHGQAEGATELVLLHQQLRGLIDDKAAKGPLGAGLLPLGRTTLQQAVAAWREGKAKQLALAQDVETALKEWGEVPLGTFGLPSQAGKDEVARVFGQPVEGRAVTAASADDVQRAYDLLDLPVPMEGCRAVVAFLDARDRLGDVLVLYKPKINEAYPEPADLAYRLLERGFTGSDPTSSPGQVRRAFEGGGLGYEVTLLTLSNAAGGFIRIGPPSGPDAKAPAVFARNPRDFGAVHLDRSFEANRVRLDSALAGDTLKVEKKAVLEKIAQPIAGHAPEAAVLKREAGQDLVAELILRWPADLGQDGLYRLALPLWRAFGWGRLDAVEDVNGGCLTLTWENPTTRVCLLIPNGEHSPELVVEDRHGKEALQARLDAADRLDLEDRLARLAAGKPLTRLARTLQVNAPSTNGLQFDGLHLGMTREEALAALPGSQTLRRQPLADGLNLLFLSEPPPGAAYWARQMFLRFGRDNKLAEVRVRYQEGAAKPGAKNPGLLDDLKRTAGGPEQLPAPWAGLWTDLSAPRRAPVLYRWRDDLTQLTLQQDAGGAEVVLRDLPADTSAGAGPGPLQFCGRGVERCSLGEPRSEVLRRYNLHQPPRASNGAELLTEPATSPYDVLLVWFDKDRVSRVIARHRARGPLAAADAGAALQAAWSADMDRLGYVRRLEGQQGQVHAAYGWHDDVTRVRTFAQDTEDGVRLFTEFREWPVPTKTVASRSTPEVLP